MATFMMPPMYKVNGIHRNYNALADQAIFSTYITGANGQVQVIKSAYSGEYLEGGTKAIQAGLIESMYSYGGPEMGQAMEEHFAYQPVGWTDIPPDISYGYEYPELSWGKELKSIQAKKVTHVSFDYPSSDSQYISGTVAYGKTHSFSVSSKENVYFDNIKALMTGEPLPKTQGPGPNMDDVNALPGMEELVKHPPLKTDDKYPQCYSVGESRSVKDLVIHLNDSHKWTREEIADWLESLDVDLTFKTPEARLRESKEKEIARLRAKMENFQLGLKYAQDNMEKFSAQVKATEAEIKKLTNELENSNE